MGVEDDCGSVTLVTRLRHKYHEHSPSAGVCLVFGFLRFSSLTYSLTHSLTHYMLNSKLPDTSHVNRDVSLAA